MTVIKRIFKSIALGSVFFILVSCATVKNPNDPLEPFNRAVYSFNHSVDYVIFRPLAIIYDTLTPNIAQKGVSNFFYNFYEPTRIINDILRAEFTHAAHDLGRLVINTSVGIVGLFDIASNVGLPRHRSDLGMTFAKWGYRESTFIMIPIFGPTTFRDGIGYVFDIYAFSPWLYINPPSVAWSLYGVEMLHKRAELLPADELIRDAMDPYVFVRDAYLQKRRSELAQTVKGYYDEKKESKTSTYSTDTFVPE